MIFTLRAELLHNACLAQRYGFLACILLRKGFLIDLDVHSSYVHCAPGEGGTAIYGPYRYVPL